jgi:hypothetical protein
MLAALPQAAGGHRGPASRLRSAASWPGRSSTAPWRRPTEEGAHPTPYLSRYVVRKAVDHGVAGCWRRPCATLRAFGGIQQRAFTRIDAAGRVLTADEALAWPLLTEAAMATNDVCRQIEQLHARKVENHLVFVRLRARDNDRLAA